MCMASTWNSWSAWQGRGERHCKCCCCCNNNNIYYINKSGVWWRWFWLENWESHSLVQIKTRPSQTGMRLLFAQASPVHCQTNGTWKRHLRHDTLLHSIVCALALSRRWTCDAADWFCWVETLQDTLGKKLKMKMHKCSYMASLCC